MGYGHASSPLHLRIRFGSPGYAARFRVRFMGLDHSYQEYACISRYTWLWQARAWDLTFVLLPELGPQRLRVVLAGAEPWFWARVGLIFRGAPGWGDPRPRVWNVVLLRYLCLGLNGMASPRQKQTVFFCRVVWYHFSLKTERNQITYHAPWHSIGLRTHAGAVAEKSEVLPHKATLFKMFDLYL